jgi:hypothetical protein
MLLLLPGKVDALVDSHFIQPTPGIFNGCSFFNVLVKIDKHLLNQIGSIITVGYHLLDHIENEPIVVVIYLIKGFQRFFYV